MSGSSRISSEWRSRIDQPNGRTRITFMLFYARGGGSGPAGEPAPEGLSISSPPVRRLGTAAAHQLAAGGGERDQLIQAEQLSIAATPMGWRL